MLNHVVHDFVKFRCSAKTSSQRSSQFGNGKREVLKFFLSTFAVDYLLFHFFLCVLWMPQNNELNWIRALCVRQERQPALPTYSLGHPAKGNGRAFYPLSPLYFRLLRARVYPWNKAFPVCPHCLSPCLPSLWLDVFKLNEIFRSLKSAQYVPCFILFLSRLLAIIIPTGSPSFRREVLFVWGKHFSVASTIEVKYATASSTLKSLIKCRVQYVNFLKPFQSADSSFHLETCGGQFLP